MRIPQQSGISARGGLLAVALMMTMVVGIFLAGWVSLSTARVMQAQYSGYAAKRHIMVESSRNYVRQMCLEQAFSGYSSVPAASTGDIDSGWGGIYTGPLGWTGLELYGQAPTRVAFPATGYYSTKFPFNALGLRPNACFANVQVLTRPPAYDGSTAYQTLDPFNGYAFLKGIFPAFGGDAMVVYRKPDRAPGEINISNFQVGDNSTSRPGRFVLRDPASLYNSAQLDLGVKRVLDLRAKSFYVQKYDPLNPVLVKTLTGAEFMPSNLPAAPSTFGQRLIRPASGGTPVLATTTQLFRGDLNIIDNDYVPPGLPATVEKHPNCLWEIQNREALKTTSPVPLQTISVRGTTGTSSEPWWIADETSSPAVTPPNYPSGYNNPFLVLHINLNSATLPNLRIYPVVDQVIFHGQTTNLEFVNAATMAPRIILFLPPASGSSQTFKDVRFLSENSRPFILGMKAQVTGEPVELYWMPPSVATATPLTLDWRMILINEGRQVSCYRPTGAGGTPDSVVLTGGIFTNWSVQRNQPSATGGAADSGAASKFIVLPEVMPVPATASSYYFASILPREAWFENFFQLVPP